MLNHDVFNNRQRSGYEELKTYQPLWWAQILEMRANNRFAGYTLDRMADDLEKLIANQFFDSCSEEMIERFEEFLGINGIGKDLEERRNNVQLTWLGGLKMNRTRIKSIVKTYCDCKCEVYLTDAYLIIEMVFKDEIANIRNLLKNSTIPAHIGIIFRCRVDLDIITGLKNDITVVSIVNKINSITHQQQIAKCACNFILKQQENFDATIVVKKNLYYLDGSQTLDGSLLLNSYIVEEDL